ncbi:MAG TPA: RNA 2',3'-cyclic phosphodiesterase [Blastocatellia bacterium]|nr:RNA 2',3'-cyclic phosphodiesterase [Blastocatellia bacterium]
MIRTFLCIELPETSRGILGEVIARLKSHHAPISWQTPSKLHVTLVFLGDVSEDRLAGVIDASRAVAQSAPRFSLSIEGLGAFPSLQRPRTLWAGVVGDRTALATLASRLESAFVPIGFNVSGNPYRPHITIGRIRAGRDAAIAAVMRTVSEVDVRSPAFDVREIVVMRSDLAPNGARYTPLAKLELAGASPTGNAVE